MRVVLCSSFGPIDQLVLDEQPSQPLAAGQVRIAVTACGVNYVDGLIVQGLYQLKPVLPFVPGGEVAGVVTEISWPPWEPSRRGCRLSLTLSPG